MRRSVLQDHKRQGRRLITPLNASLGGRLADVSWVKSILPELLWIGLLQEDQGINQGEEIIAIVCRRAETAYSGDLRKIFSVTSGYRTFSVTDAEKLKEQLRDDHVLGDLQRSLAPLISWYRDCPLRIFGSGNESRTDEGLHKLKSVVSTLFDRTSREAALVQTTAVRVGFDAGVIVFARKDLVPDFNEMEHYPETERSRREASKIRAMVPMILDDPSEMKSPWPEYFWNQGISNDPCEFADERLIHPRRSGPP